MPVAYQVSRGFRVRCFLIYEQGQFEIYFLPLQAHIVLLLQVQEGLYLLAF